METELAPHEVRLSRFIAMVLRHKPGTLGLELDEEGWVGLPDFLTSLQKSWRKGPVTREIIRRIVDLDPKGRYEIETTVRPHRIRASYGHSVSQSPSYPEIPPPPVLYHGTARRFLGRIRAAGLHPMGRHYVHLSDDIETARQVGARRDPLPVILRIDAEAMARDGHRFYQTAAGVYLADAVPSGYLVIEEDPGAEGPGGA